MNLSQEQADAAFVAIVAHLADLFALSQEILAVEVSA